jgi:hypothetical protein
MRDMETSLGSDQILYEGASTGCSYVLSMPKDEFGGHLDSNKLRINNLKASR